jgi:lysophospholipase L1-like esterase
MKYFFLLFLIFIIGCGGGGDNTNSGSNGGGGSTTDNKTYKSLSAISKLIKNNNDVTYIIVGDSTRSTLDSPKYLPRMKETLDKYNVTSILHATSGYKLEWFAYPDRNPLVKKDPSYETVIADIPNDGTHTIVDISLAVNDMWDEKTKSALVDNLKKSVSLIKASKPKTIFLFTSPNPMRTNNSITNIYINAYKTVSQEIEIPFINYYDNVFKNYTQDQKDLLYRNEKMGADKVELGNVHFSEKGQIEMADYVLEQLGL